MVFSNSWCYFWGHDCCWRKTSIIDNDFFVFHKFALPSTLLLPPALRCSGVLVCPSSQLHPGIEYHCVRSPVEVPELQGFIVKWIAFLNSWLSCKVDSCAVSDSNLSGCPLNPTKSLWFVSVGNKSSFAFSNYIQLWRCLSTRKLFLKPSTETNFNQKTTSVVRWQPQALISANLWNKLERRFSLKFVNGGDEPNLLKLVFVIFSPIMSPQRFTLVRR